MVNPRSPNPAPPSNPLVGQFFHSLDENGNVQWQGQVLGPIQTTLTDAHYFVSLFGWITQNTTNKIVRLSAMKDWIFYSSEEDMKWEYDQIYRPKLDRFLAQQERQSGQ